MHNLHVPWMIKTLNIWLFKNETLLKTNACHSHRFKIAFFSYVEERGMQIEQDFMYAFYFDHWIMSVWGMSINSSLNLAFHCYLRWKVLLCFSFSIKIEQSGHQFWSQEWKLWDNVEKTPQTPMWAFNTFRGTKGWGMGQEQTEI